MGKLKLFLGASILLFCSVANAEIKSVGDLSTETDGSSNIIYDSLNNREWLRWNILADLTFAQTLEATTTGAYSDFTIANQFDAAKFMTAAGGGSACIDPTNNTNVSCSRISVGSESIFGDDHEEFDDIAWFLSTDSDGSEVGHISHQFSGVAGSMSISWESPNTIMDTDDYSSIGRFSDSTISWLLYRDIDTDAANLQVDSNGQLTGATGVLVDGSFYDVEFVDGTCTEVFGICEQESFIFKTNVTAALASEALIEQVFLDVALGAFDSDPSLTNGCELNDAACNIFTPFNAGIDIPSEYATNFAASTGADDTTGGSSPSRGIDFGDNDAAVWARWSAPPPATIVDNETDFMGLVSSVFTEGFESFPTNTCETGGPSPSDNINTANFSVTTMPQNGGTSFLCTGTTSAGLPGPTEGTNALIAGSNTGDTWILEFTMSEAIHGVYFELTDAVERGDAFLLVSGFDPILVASQGSGGLNTVRFGAVFDSPFTSFSLSNTGRSDGWGIDNMLFAQVPTPITIDIKPGSDPNSINPRSKGVIPVAVLGSTDFDATQVDFSTVTFGPDGASPVHDGHVEDVNDDGYPDMVFHFRTQETGIVCGDTEAALTGETFGGIQFTGTDAVKMVGCK